MAKNKMNDLRDHLFETLEALKDTDKPLELERAKAISDIAQTIINSAKVEVDLVKAIGGSPGSQFFQVTEDNRLFQLSESKELGAMKSAKKVGGLGQR